MDTGGQTWVETVEGFEISSGMSLTTIAPEIRLDTTGHRLTQFAIDVECFGTAVVQCYIRYTDADNYILMQWGNEQFMLKQVVAGVIKNNLTRDSVGTFCRFDCQIAASVVTITWRSWCPHGWQPEHIERFIERLTDGDALRIATTNTARDLITLDDVVIAGTER